MLGLPVGCVANLLVSAGIALEFVSYLPQIVRLVKSRRSMDLSVGSWVLWAGGDFIGLVYAFVYTGDFMFFLYYAVTFLLILTTLFLTVKYRR